MQTKISIILFVKLKKLDESKKDPLRFKILGHVAAQL
jgi:hypothetical protein